ncbi:MAG: ThiF family adenylyltransferase [Candidatus Norongarragalinales archaeon]
MNFDDDVFDRQKRMRGWNQEALERTRVLVVGAGALGNEVVKLLLQLGVRKLTLVDNDSVVKANLNRCVFFNERDAEDGVLKVDALTREAKRLFPEASVAALPKLVEQLPESFYENFDFAFACLDNLGARLHLNAFTYGRVPLVDGGTTGFLGKVQVVKAPSACLECGLSKRDYKLLWLKYSCVGEEIDWLNPKMPALPTTTSVIAAIQVEEFLKLLFFEAAGKGADEEMLIAAGEGSLVGRYLHYDALRRETRVFEVPKRASCPVHRV